MQLEGSKRWKLWLKPSLLHSMIIGSVGKETAMGKSDATQLLPAKLGPPSLDVVLSPVSTCANGNLWQGFCWL